MKDRCDRMIHAFYQACTVREHSKCTRQVKLAAAQKVDDQRCDFPRKHQAGVRRIHDTMCVNPGQPGFLDADRAIVRSGKPSQYLSQSDRPASGQRIPKAGSFHRTPRADSGW